jgi:hypothetical protein
MTLLPNDERTITLIEMLEEIGTWVDTPCDIKIKASDSKISTENSPKLKKLIREWERGRYDEDVDKLHQELISLLN